MNVNPLISPFKKSNIKLIKVTVEYMSNCELSPPEVQFWGGIFGLSRHTEGALRGPS